MDQAPGFFGRSSLRQEATSRRQQLDRLLWDREGTKIHIFDRSSAQGQCCRRYCGNVVNPAESSAKRREAILVRFSGYLTASRQRRLQDGQLACNALVQIGSEQSGCRQPMVFGQFDSGCLGGESVHRIDVCRIVQVI